MQKLYNDFEAARSRASGNKALVLSSVAPPAPALHGDPAAAAPHQQQLPLSANPAHPSDSNALPGLDNTGDTVDDMVKPDAASASAADEVSERKRARTSAAVGAAVKNVVSSQNVSMQLLIEETRRGHQAREVRVLVQQLGHVY